MSTLCVCVYLCASERVYAYRQYIAPSNLFSFYHPHTHSLFFSILLFSWRPDRTPHKSELTLRRMSVNSLINTKIPNYILFYFILFFSLSLVRSVGSVRFVHPFIWYVSNNIHSVEPTDVANIFNSNIEADGSWIESGTMAMMTTTVAAAAVTNNSDDDDYED